MSSILLAAESVVPADSVLASYSSNLLLANLALAFVLPQLVALVTAKVAQPPLKAILLLLLSAIGGLLTQIITDQSEFHWRQAIMSCAQVFLGGVAAHYGILKPTGVTGSSGVIQTSVPQGLGSGGGIPPAGNGGQPT